jgi:nicotinate-nucleotide adenylyltransferase
VKVGILGGTFDPVHNGHLALADHARRALGLDLVLFVPAGQPWRKADRTITPAEHRLAMLKLAIAGNEAYGISDVELRRNGPTYTADTLEALSGERLDDEFYFIVGADALADLPNWRDPERIIKHAMLAVAPRDGEAPPLPLIPNIDQRIVHFEMPPVETSSTDIRDRAASGRTIDDAVPPAVASYISEHNLYR